MYDRYKDEEDNYILEPLPNHGKSTSVIVMYLVLCVLCPSQCNPWYLLDFSALLGSNDESLGWNIVANESLFNDCVINKYPDDVNYGFEAPEVIRVVLNMDEGTLRFKSAIDGTDYGLCHSGLRAFSRNGQELYPAISATMQGAQIGIKYLGRAGILSVSISMSYKKVTPFPST